MVEWWIYIPFLHSTWLYLTLLRLYITLFDSNWFYHSFSSLYCTLPWLYSCYFTLHYFTMGVQRYRNLWSCDDRKGHSLGDQHFFEHFREFKGTKTCGHAMIRKGTPLKTCIYLWIFLNETPTCHDCSTQLNHKCPIPTSQLCLTSHFMCVPIFTWWTSMCQPVLVLPHSTHKFHFSLLDSTWPYHDSNSHYKTLHGSNWLCLALP